MTRRHVTAIIVFLAVGTIVHQPGASSLETGLIAAACAGLYLGAVAYFKDRMV